MIPKVITGLRHIRRMTADSSPPQGFLMTARQDNLVAAMIGWRRELHAHPEFGFEERRTAAFVAERLRSFGLTDVVEGVGGTGVVATLDRGEGVRIVGLRADMDALQIHEHADHDHQSRSAGVMHACGHDGHTTMLLGAAQLLMTDPAFKGKVRFIFQPAEEWGRGARAMLDDGLLQRFRFDEVYGLHNFPGSPVGAFETRVGPLMAAEDNFEIVFVGQGGHASRPHTLREVMVAACTAVVGLQTIVARRLDPPDAAVVSVTELWTDGARNVLPGEARIFGDARSFRLEVSQIIEAEMRRIVAGIATSFNCEARVDYTRSFVPLINHLEQTQAALEAARKVFGPAAVVAEREPITASEDFAQFLQEIPGCFAFIGNGIDSAPLHSSTYDFDDRSLLSGAQFFHEIAKLRSTEHSAD